jgi:protein O-mannosyl-transferase
MPREARQVFLAAIALVLLGALIYCGTLDSPFLMDDGPSIEEAQQIEALWPLSKALSAPPGSGQSGRPLVALSLAVNYALGAREVVGYHVFNIAVHVLAALALFGVARRVLLATGESEHRRPTELAFAIAALWVVHPLHTDALNHVIYRNETMMALFYLVTLYCALRFFEGGRKWSVFAVLACIASMACKEVAVSLPLAVLAFDAFFGAGGFRAALRARPAFYAALAASWLALALFISSGDRGESVGLEHSEIIGSVDYLRTQLVAVPLYLRLTFLPWPLIFDYFDGQVIRSWTPVLLPAVLLTALLAFSLHAFCKGRVAGLLGLAVAVILAPSSSVIPLAGELIAEHRMVLPLAPLIAMVVIFVHRLLSRLGERRRMLAPALLVITLGALAATTVARNADYASTRTLWLDTVEKRPQNARAWNQLGLALRDEGDPEAAAAAFLESIELDPQSGTSQFNLANLYFGQGRMAEAARYYGESIEHREPDAIAYYNHGSTLLLSGQVARGLEQYERALELQPGWEPPASRLAWFRATHADATLRDGAQALRVAEELVRVNGRAPRALDILAAALAEVGRFDEAQSVAAEAAGAAREAGDAQLAGQIDSRARLYAAEEPFRKP